MIDSPVLGSFLVLHLIMDVRDAMGANAVNTAVERLAPHGRAADRRAGSPAHPLQPGGPPAGPRHLHDPQGALAFGEYSAEKVRDGIIAAWAFAEADPYRAATHNKGIMNGVDAVVIATGNDWRAVEAGAHAYAARTGRYTSLSTWSAMKTGDLVGTLEMPMAVGIVGGATKVHPTGAGLPEADGCDDCRQLAEIIVSVGLAQNLAALRALATEGIQRGHMSLHARQVAIAAGAAGDRYRPAGGAAG